MEIITSKWHYKWYVFVTEVWLLMFDSNHRFHSGCYNGRRHYMDEFDYRTTSKTNRCLYWRTVWFYPIVLVVSQLVFYVASFIAVVGFVLVFFEVFLHVITEESWIVYIIGSALIIAALSVLVTWLNSRFSWFKTMVAGIMWVLHGIADILYYVLIWPFIKIWATLKWLYAKACPTYTFEAGKPKTRVARSTAAVTTGTTTITVVGMG